MWLNESFGSNWRMTELQAVIGRIQLKRMPNWHTKRITNANKIWNIAKQCKGLRVPNIPDNIEHAAYKCYMFVELKELKDGWGRNRIIKEINTLGVPCYFGLGAGVFTKDLKKASWTASKLEAGQVYVNKWFTGSHATPFGGYKQSGYSREKGIDALKAYVQIKNVGISLD